MSSFWSRLVVLLSLGYCTQTNGQEIDLHSKKQKIDTSYKISLRNLVLLKLDANTESNGIAFKKINGQRDFNLAPNNDINLRITAHYKFFGLSYQFSPFHPNESTKGKSTSKVIALDVVVSNHLNLSYSYGTTTGYYLENTKDYIRELTNPNLKYAVFSDVKTKLFRAENFYYFNGNKFSVRFPVNQYEIQRKSAGSFVIPINYYYSKLDFRNEQFKDLTFSANNVYPNYLSDNYFITGFGYAYNWVIKPNWVMNMRANPIGGLDFNYTTFTNQTFSRKKQFTYGYQAAATLAYITPNWMGGLSADVSGWKALSNTSDLTGKQNRFKIFVGKCFGAPKALAKSFAWLENKFSK